MIVFSNIMLVMKTEDVERIHMKDLGSRTKLGPRFMQSKRRMAVDTVKKAEIMLKNEFAPCLIRMGKDMLVRVEVVNGNSGAEAYLKVSPLYSSVRAKGAGAVLQEFKRQFNGELVAELPGEIRYKEIQYDPNADDYLEFV